MGKGVYYNEFNRQKAAWLRHLIEEGEIAHGVVDERSIAEVQPEELDGFAQHHFFAGIGLWSLCLRRAGWPDDRPVWTGSCPCGPFSKAGLRQGFEDPRHLWPEWLRLISVCRPGVLFGEQSDEALAWLDLVSADLEGRGYAIGPDIIPAAGFGGAHERHRIGFVADTDNAEWWSERAPWNDGFWPKTGRVQGDRHAPDGGQGFGMAYANTGGQPEQPEHDGSASSGGVFLGSGGEPGGCSSVRRLGDASSDRSATDGRDDGEVRGVPKAQRQPEHGTSVSWRSGHALGLVDATTCGLRMGGGGVGHLYQPDVTGALDWVLGRDGLWRPVEPGLSPLIDADSSRMGRLRGYGDAIDVETFTQLIAAYMDVAPVRLAA